MSQQWIKTSDRLPISGPSPIWIHKNTSPEYVALLYGTPSVFEPSVTHWMPAEIPAPPKSEPETAWDDWAKVHPVPPGMHISYISYDYAKTCFLSGFEAGRKGGAS